MKVRRTGKTAADAPLLIRSLQPEDAKAVLTLCRRAAGETENLMRGEHEWTIGEEEMRARIHKAETGAKSLLIGAFVSGRLAAAAIMRPAQQADRARHRACVGIVVLRAYWHQGIGKLMLETLVDAAKGTNLEQLELSVADHNAGAIALYASCGFMEYGRHPRMMKHRDGHYSDAVLMMLDLRKDH